MSTIRVRGLGVEVPVNSGETILSALCRAGMSYTYGCRRGGCGVCTATVRSGTTSYAGKTIAESACSAEKRAQGIVLTCRAVPEGDVEIEFAPESNLRVAVPLTFGLAVATVAKAKMSATGGRASNEVQPTKPTA